MKIAEFAGGVNTVEGQVQSVVNAENDGFDSIWFGQVFGPDVLTVLAMAGQKTNRIELGTSEEAESACGGGSAQEKEELRAQLPAAGSQEVGLGVSTQGLSPVSR